MISKGKDMLDNQRPRLSEVQRRVLRSIPQAALIFACSSPSLSPVLRSQCEERFGREWLFLSRSEAQPVALASEVIAALAAGLTVAEIAFCLSLEIWQVRRAASLDAMPSSVIHCDV
jgi:hypothetical protein